MTPSRIHQPGKLVASDASWAERFLARFLWHEDIPRDGGGVYMRRFFLRGEAGGDWRWALHCFHRSDEDDAPHDHPFDFKTTVVWGGYIDEEWDRRHQIIAHHRMGFLSTAKRSALHIHRVKLQHEGRRTWTFVRRSERWREWGFWTKDGFVPWRKYLNVA